MLGPFNDNGAKGRHPGAVWKSHIDNEAFADGDSVSRLGHAFNAHCPAVGPIRTDNYRSTQLND